MYTLWIIWDKYSSLLSSDKEKKFHDIDTWLKCSIPFFFFTDATSES